MEGITLYSQDIYKIINQKKNVNKKTKKERTIESNYNILPLSFSFLKIMKKDFSYLNYFPIKSEINSVKNFFEI